MNVKMFKQYAVHLDNFYPDQLVRILDTEGIKELPDSPNRQIAVESLGQFLVGNRSDPIDTYMSLDDLDKRLFLDTWFSCIKDSHELQKIGLFVAHRLIAK